MQAVLESLKQHISWFSATNTETGSPSTTHKSAALPQKHKGTAKAPFAHTLVRHREHPAESSVLGYWHCVSISCPRHSKQKSSSSCPERAMASGAAGSLHHGTLSALSPERSTPGFLNLGSGPQCCREASVAGSQQLTGKKTVVGLCPRAPPGRGRLRSQEEVPQACSAPLQLGEKGFHQCQALGQLLLPSLNKNLWSQWTGLGGHDWGRGGGARSPQGAGLRRAPSFIKLTLIGWGCGTREVEDRCSSGNGRAQRPAAADVDSLGEEGLHRDSHGGECALHPMLRGNSEERKGAGRGGKRGSDPHLPRRPSPSKPTPCPGRPPTPPRPLQLTAACRASWSSDCTCHAPCRLQPRPSAHAAAKNPAPLESESQQRRRWHWGPASGWGERPQQAAAASVHCLR